MDQAFLNLLLNAKDAVALAEKSSSLISVAVERISMKATQVAALRPDFLRVQVSDDGIGMDEETRERIFELFFTTTPIGAVSYRWFLNCISPTTISTLCNIHL